MTKIITFIKQKEENNTYAVFYNITMSTNRINWNEYYYHVKQFILVSANSYCNFHIFSYTMYYNFHCELPHCTFMFPFLFHWSHIKAGAVHSSDSSLFCKKSIINQLNIQAVTAENKEQYTLSNIVYIAFQNSYSFHWSFLW